MSTPTLRGGGVGIFLEFGDLDHQTGSFSPTQFMIEDVGQLKVNNNRIMYQMSIKLPAMFDQNPPHTDKIVKKLIT